MKFNFTVRAVAWDTPDKDTWEADFVPMWFDEETKKKIYEVIEQGYNRYKHKRKDRDKHKNKNKDKSVIENDTVPAGEYNFLQGWDDGPKVTVK
tara:strand:+ start:372 stop:653 length:282 start_codon:yes stop_codon:yes gene_type:complete